MTREFDRGDSERLANPLPAGKFCGGATHPVHCRLYADSTRADRRAETRVHWSRPNSRAGFSLEALPQTAW